MTTQGRPSEFKDGALDSALARLLEILAIIQMIEDGDLLARLPAGEEAARDHQRAVSLLAVLHRELDSLVDELTAAQLAIGAVARLTNRASPP